MKKLFLGALLIIMSISLFSCADSKTINGVTYRPYGIFNEGSAKNPNIHYEVSGEAVFSGVMFAEFFLIPTIYTFGYNIYEPKCTMAEYNQNINNGVVK